MRRKTKRKKNQRQKSCDVNKESWETAEVLLAQAVGSSFSLEFTFAS